jgi:predicted Fe-S protein YdhL (DUF1289 family)
MSSQIPLQFRQGNSPSTVPSPCNGVCRIQASTQWCAGCGRTLEEITLWSRLDDASRLRVWQALAQRGFSATVPVIR